MPLAKAIKEWVRLPCFVPKRAPTQTPVRSRTDRPSATGSPGPRLIPSRFLPLLPRSPRPAPSASPQETRNSKVAADEKQIFLYGGMAFGEKRSFINKLDGTLSALKSCERLSLSTNQIDRMAPMTGMDSLKVLTLSRNALKKIERLEDVAGTLEEIWLSYNQISSLDGLQACNKLQVLYMGNNKIADWGELDKVAGLPELRDVLFVGA
jgi:hypothetical protein